MRKAVFSLKKAVVGLSALLVLSGGQFLCAEGAKDNSKSAAKPSAATAYPTKAIQVVIPVGAGGDTDVNARLFGKYLEKELGQPVIIVNVSGGGGTIGMKRVLESAPDGYTALFYHGEAMIPKIAGLVNYGLEAFDMCGVALVDDTTVLATHPGMPFKTMKEFVDYAKANPYKVEFGMMTGGYPHLVGIALQELAGIQLNLVDVGANAAKTVALKGRKTGVINTQYGLTKDFFTAGDFVNLGLTSQKRNPLFPDVQTTTEQGFPMEFNKFFFYAMPKGTPVEIVNKFSAAMKKVVENADYKAEAAKSFVTPTYMGPAEATKHAETQYAFFAKYQDLFRAGSKK